MARKVILETAYTFTPVTKTVVIPRHIPRERLLLITNVTANQVIYNFSDPNLNATSYTATVTGATGITTVVLNYNTGAMNSTDKLQFTIDEVNESFEPAESYLDSTNKLRVTTPQALIDTDFEYGTQTSKWENLALTNNRPYAFASPVVLTVSAIAITNRTVTVSTTTPPTVGTPIVVADTYLSIANGVFTVDTVSAGVSFTYTARATSTLAGGSSILDVNKTTVNTGSFYTGSALTSSALTQAAFSSDAATGASKITVTLAVAHGLSIGNEIQVVSPTASAASSAAVGSFFVAQIISPTSFAYYTRATQANPLTTGSDYNIYARAAGTVLHRPFDGGVIFSANSGSNYAQQIRQTRRYFRYQSGKGIQVSSGSILKPNFQVDSLVYTLSTNTVAVTLKDLHNIQQIPPGTFVTVTGATEAGFNGTFAVTTVTGANSFTYTPTVGAITSNTTASGTYYVCTSSWYGAVNRLGIFDQQNGLFFEFDGQILYVVRRNSTYQLSGRVDVTNGATTVGNNSIFSTTAFSKQLTPGDYVVIKGQSYRVDTIASDTSMTISPAYRGATASAVIVSKTIDTKIPQSQWNIDKMDGTGPSGYNIDLTKMQMFYVDYSWYGAGFVRWGIRAKNGDVAYIHKLANNNVNAEAYMRSGNLPARYESTTIPPITTLSVAAGAVATNSTTITVGDTSAFPSAGVIAIRQGTGIEHVYYGAKTATQFTNIVRAQAGAVGVTSTASTTSSTISVSATTGIAVGQRVISTTANAISDGTFVTGVSGTNVVNLSQPVLSASPPLVFVPISATTGVAVTPTLTNPASVELAYPTLAPTISHWGTSVIMDGRYDDDKSLLFTYGQNVVTGLIPTGTVIPTGITGTTVSSSSSMVVSSTTGVTVGMTVTNAASSIPGNTVITGIIGTNVVTLSRAATAATSANALTFSGATAKALMSIRVAPSVDAGVAGILGARELINRMQLVLRALDVSLVGSSSNILVTLVLNGVVNASVNWTNAVGSQASVPTSSLAQIADYAGQNIGLVATNPGEVTGGFFVSSTGSVELDKVRDLGNSILGGGGTTSNTQVYPDGPDVMTIYAQNISSVGAALTARLSWTEAQA